MRFREKWHRFWTGEQWGLFFLKFFIFSIISYFIWSMFSISYGRFLSNLVIDNLRSRIPIMDVRFSDDRGLTVTVVMGPAVNEPLPLEEPKTFEVHIYPNTLHFNIIPFLAIFFASPIVNGRRTAIFLLLCLFALMISHYVHMYLNIWSFYYARQSFILDKSSMTQAQLQAAYIFYKKINLLRLSQGFMEQAGSMIMPFMLWIIYAQGWLFRKLMKPVQSQPGGSSQGSPPSAFER
ncbi:hypothetical protein JW823_00110 [bacterium]|nr:hypothetical protein [candidate division CSSED10-310 bacterium]